MSFNHKLHTFGHRKMTRGYPELSLNKGDAEGALAHPEFGVSVKRKKKNIHSLSSLLPTAPSDLKI